MSEPENYLLPLTDKEIEEWKTYHAPSAPHDDEFDTICICGEYYDECEPAKLLVTILDLQRRLKA